MENLVYEYKKEAERSHMIPLEMIVDEWIKSVLKGIGACLVVVIAVVLFMFAMAGGFNF